MKAEFKSLPEKRPKRKRYSEDEEDDYHYDNNDDRIVTRFSGSRSPSPDPPPPPAPLVPLTPEQYALGSDGWLEEGATYPVLLEIWLQGGSSGAIHMDWRKMSYSPYMRSVFKKGWRELDALPVWNWAVDDPEAVANVLWMIDTGAERCHGASPEMLVRMARVAAMYEL